jgi:UPF0755 protein
VFVNRLRKHMRLQSDPTIVYGLVGGQGPLGRPLTRADIDSPTRYNTYLIDGLPPGPIANPGRAALEAVANPSRTQDLYFVADGTGGHVFAETLDTHNRNVQRWRQIEQTSKAKPGATPGAAPALPGLVPAPTGQVPAPAQGRGDRTEYRRSSAMRRRARNSSPAAPPPRRSRRIWRATPRPSPDSRPCFPTRRRRRGA